MYVCVCIFVCPSVSLSLSPHGCTETNSIASLDNRLAFFAFHCVYQPLTGYMCACLCVWLSVCLHECVHVHVHGCVRVLVCVSLNTTIFSPLQKSKASRGQSFSMLTGCLNGSLCFWTIPGSVDCQHTISDAHETSIQSVDCRGNIAVSVGLEGCLCLWLLDKKTLLHRIPLVSGGYLSICLSLYLSAWPSAFAIVDIELCWNDHGRHPYCS